MKFILGIPKSSAVLATAWQVDCRKSSKQAEHLGETPICEAAESQSGGIDSGDGTDKPALLVSQSTKNETSLLARFPCLMLCGKI